MSVQRCRRETTSSEFVTWQVMREKEVNGFHREDYFLANIARILTQANVKDPNKVELDSFLLKFTSGDGKAKDKPLTEEEIQQRIAKSKAFWTSALGIGIEQEKTR